MINQIVALDSSVYFRLVCMIQVFRICLEEALNCISPDFTQAFAFIELVYLAVGVIKFGNLSDVVGKSEPYPVFEWPVCQQEFVLPFHREFKAPCAQVGGILLWFGSSEYGRKFFALCQHVFRITLIPVKGNAEITVEEACVEA